MNWGAFATTFVASVVEAIEMVTIVVGVGAIRGWRSTLIGAGAGFLVLLVVGGGLGTALTAIPIGALRARDRRAAPDLRAPVAPQGRAPRRRARASRATRRRRSTPRATSESRFGLDWTAFVLAFKGVLLEGLEIAFIVVTFGSAANQLWLAAIGGGARSCSSPRSARSSTGSLTRIPRSVLILVVGLLLVDVRDVLAAEGLGVALARRRPRAARCSSRSTPRPRPASSCCSGARSLGPARGGAGVSTLWGWVEALRAFWYDFVVGDDWTIAAGVVVALARHVRPPARPDVPAWWLLPLASVAIVAVAVYRANRRDRTS